MGGGVDGGRARGEMGWGHQTALWEQQKSALGPLKTGDEGGGMGGRRGEVAHRGRARGEMGEQCGSNKRCTGFPVFGLPKNLTTGLIWLVTRVGGWGAWGGGSWRAGKGGDGVPLLKPNNWSDLAGDEGGGMGGGVGRWPMEGGQGGRWAGGHQRTVWEQQKVHYSPFLAPLKT